MNGGDKVQSIHGPRDGDETWVMCPCSPNHPTVIPVVLHDPKGAIISSLVCTECEATTAVVNGILLPDFDNVG